MSWEEFSMLSNGIIAGNLVAESAWATLTWKEPDSDDDFLLIDGDGSSES